MAEELPQPKPESPVIRTQQDIRIRLGKKRYSLQVTTEAHEIKPEPARILEFPDLPGNK